MDHTRRPTAAATKPRRRQILTAPSAEVRRAARVMRRIATVVSASQRRDSWAEIRDTIRDLKIVAGRLTVLWWRRPSETIWAATFVVAIEEGLIPPAYRTPIKDGGEQ